MFEILKTLCELSGPGGDEGLVQDFLAKRWGPLVKSVSSSHVGNLMAHFGGHGQRLMIAAHADEICFIVRYISDDGFVWISTGKQDIEQRPTLRGTVLFPWGHPARILTTSGFVDGVFATLTGHILTPEQRDKTRIEWNDVFVDIGARNRAEAEDKGIQIGDRIICNAPIHRIGDIVYGKAIDDRVGLAIIDRLLNELDPNRLQYDVTMVSTVQEEIGLIGAESAAIESGCEMAIALDIGLAGDVPGVDQRDVSTRLGAGPIILHKDRYNYSRPFCLQLIRTAEAANIPIQQAVFSRFSTDAGAFTSHGLKAAALLIPTRYSHSPFEMIHLQDVENAYLLLRTLLEAKI